MKILDSILLLRMTQTLKKCTILFQTCVIIFIPSEVCLLFARLFVSIKNDFYTETEVHIHTLIQVTFITMTESFVGSGQYCTCVIDHVIRITSVYSLSIVPYARAIKLESNNYQLRYDSLILNLSIWSVVEICLGTGMSFEVKLILHWRSIPFCLPILQIFVRTV